MKTFPKLYGKSKSGKIKEWNIYTVDQDKYAEVITEYGYQDGEKQTSRLEFKKGKNIGKSNETTAFQQAINEAQSKWKQQKDKGYTEDANSIPQDLLPMLAKIYGIIINGKLQKRDCKYIKFPCFVQPKLDGVRCLSKRINGVIEFISRKGKNYKTLAHIETELKSIMEVGEIFDGEIYVHKQRFQDIISAVKNVKSKDAATLSNKKLKYYIYDLADKTLPFEERNRILQQKFRGKKFKHLVLVDTFRIDTEKEVLAHHKIFVKDGYEGVIIRNKNGLYEFDNRSFNLQKLKEFFDEEFMIVDVRTGVGRYTDCGTIICQTNDGKLFDVNPEGTMEEKKEYLKNKHKYIGKSLTIRYQEKSKDGIPRFGVGVAVVRDYE